MAYTLLVKKRFTRKIISLLQYLEKEWSKKIALEFEEKLYKRMEQLISHPYMGTPSSSIKGVRSLLITKHNRLYYRIKGNKIEIMNLYDTRRNPKKNRYYP